MIRGMFSESAEWYDAFYRTKDYAGEAVRVVELIRGRQPRASFPARRRLRHRPAPGALLPAVHLRGVGTVRCLVSVSEHMYDSVWSVLAVDGGVTAPDQRIEAAARLITGRPVQESDPSASTGRWVSTPHEATRRPGQADDLPR